jgi:hypothetical protein
MSDGTLSRELRALRLLADLRARCFVCLPWTENGRAFAAILPQQALSAEDAAAAADLAEELLAAIQAGPPPPVLLSAGLTTPSLTTQNKG